MVKRDPIDPEATTKFATALLIRGLTGLTGPREKADGAGL
jgi:hypothetical protein